MWSPGGFRACSRCSGPRGDGSGRREKRGALGGRKRQGASAAAPGSAEDPRPSAGPGVVRQRFEARWRPGASFVAALAAAALAAAVGRGSAGLWKASPPPTVRLGLGRGTACGLRGAGARACMCGGPGPGEADVGRPEARRRREAAGGLGA